MSIKYRIVSQFNKHTAAIVLYILVNNKKYISNTTFTTMFSRNARTMKVWVVQPHLQNLNNLYLKPYTVEFVKFVTGRG